MSKEIPSFAASMGGVAVLVVPFLWYFDWAGWAWVVAAVIAVVGAFGWLSETLKHHRATRENPGSSHADSQYSYSPAPSDDDDLLSGGRVVWQGSRQVSFDYQSFGGDGTNREVTVHKVVSKGRGNSDTYFQGLCHLRGETRTFRLDRIKGKVVDASTGEMATFRQLFELGSR